MTSWLALILTGSFMEYRAIKGQRVTLSHVCRKVPRPARAVALAWIVHHFLFDD